jgi:hypothetical protein
MTHYVGLDVSQKMTAICVVDASVRRLWRGQCTSDPEQIERTVRRHDGADARIGIETGPMSPWLEHCLASSAPLDAMTRPSGCRTRTAARMWYLEPSCMLLIACMTSNGRPRRSAAGWLTTPRMGEDAP